MYLILASRRTQIYSSPAGHFSSTHIRSAIQPIHTHTRWGIPRMTYIVLGLLCAKCICMAGYPIWFCMTKIAVALRVWVGLKSKPKVAGCLQQLKGDLSNSRCCIHQLGERR